MTPRGGRPTGGAKGEKAMSNAEQKLQRGKPSKSKTELPGITIRRGRKEGA